MEIRVIIAAVVAVASAFLLTFGVRKLSPILGFMDIPRDDRRMHETAVPRAGGVAVYIAFLIAMCITGLWELLLPYAVCGTIIMAVGLADDKISISPKTKLVVQALAGAVLCLFGITVEELSFFGLELDLGWAAYPLTVIWVIAITNVFNLIDGLDGLCCGLSIIGAGAIGLLAYFDGNTELIICSLLFVASCVGFLPHNAHKAKIFIGDSGAMLCGFTLATLSCQTVFESRMSVPSLTAIVIFGIPLFDATFAVIRRIKGKSNIFVGDKKHVHHRLSARYGHRNAVILLYVGALLLGGIAILMGASLVCEIIAVILFVLVLAYAIVRFGIYKN